MKTRLTIASLRARDSYLRFGDLLLFPEPFTIPDKIRLADEVTSSPVLTEQLLKFAPGCQPGKFAPNTTLNTLLIEYDRQSDYARRMEPSWVRLCSPELRLYLRTAEPLINHTLRPLAIQPHVAYAGFGFMYLLDGFVHDICDFLRLFRLQGVRQLAFLHDPVARSGDHPYSCGTLFGHSRFEHVLTVTAIARLIAYNVRIRRCELKHLLVAALSHDVLTPAGGDTTKQLNPELFDEDSHFEELFVTSGWKKLQRKYKLDQQLVLQTIRNCGLLGQILDLADKLAYVARDVHYFVDAFPLARLGNPYPPGYQAISRLLQSDRHICGLWECVAAENGELVILNPYRLNRFLKLRTLLFQELYNNPRSRFCEFFLTMQSLRQLFQSGEIVRNDLLNWQDFELEQKVERYGGKHPRWWTEQFNVVAETFPNLSAARARQAELGKQGVTEFVVEDLTHQASTGANIKVLCKGQPVTFAQAFPHKAAVLEGIVREGASVRLYYRRNVSAHRCATRS